MKLPPYAKELNEARRRGLVPELPSGWFLVALGWDVNRQIPDVDRYPRVVLPLDAAAQDYNLRPLAGLDLLLVYARADADRVAEAAECLLAIRPRSLSACPLDAEGCVAWRFWHDPREEWLVRCDGAQAGQG